MPDNIERTIYKLEIDESGYIRGVENATTSTKRLAEAQEETNRALQQSLQALRVGAEGLASAKRQLDAYTGADQKYRQQLELNVKIAEEHQKKLTEDVTRTQKAYDEAKKSAEEFNNTVSKTTGIQVGEQLPVVQPVTPVAAGIPADILKTVDALKLLTQAINETTDTDLSEFIEESGKAINQLGSIVSLANARLIELRESGETQTAEFLALTNFVEDANHALEEYEHAIKAAGEHTEKTGEKVKKTGEAYGSLRTQITNARAELDMLIQSGTATEKEIAKQEIAVAKLTNAYSTQRARIRVLASDSRALDFGKSAIQSATAAFQTYTAIQVLAGTESEKLQKKTLQLFAAMQLLTSIETIHNQIKRGGVLITNLQTVSQNVYTAAIGATTGALKAFRIALLGTGVGIAVGIIGLLVKRFIDLRKAAEEAKEAAGFLKSSIGGSEYSEAVKNVNELRINIDLAKKGFIDKSAVVKQYNETVGKTTGEVKSLDAAEKELTKNADAYIRFTLLKAAAQAVFAEAAKASAKQAVDDFNLLEELRKAEAVLPKPAPPTQFRTTDVDPNTGRPVGESEQTERIREERERVRRANERRIEFLLLIAKRFQEQAAEISRLFGFNFFQTGDGKEIENVFEKERQRLLKQLEELRNQQLKGVDKINADFRLKLEEEKKRIDELLKDKKITPGQRDILIRLAIDVNDEALQQALDEFDKDILEAEKKLQRELEQLHSANVQARINLIQDEFDRRKTQIEFNEKEEVGRAKDFTTDRIEALQKEKADGLILEQDFIDAKKKIIEEGEESITNITLKYARERQRLSADIYLKSLQSYQDAIEAFNITTSQEQVNETKTLADRFFRNEINYETYQKELTKIKSKYENQRRDESIRQLNLEIFDIEKRQETIKDKNSEEFKNLEELQKGLRKRKLELEQQDVEAGVEKPTETDPRVKKIQEYADALGSITDSVIQFWAKANEAEEKALEKSIQLQEKRVEEARRLAERGNAEYLKAEEDRLNRLQVARENAARRQLAIDAALQASQVLVGITGAIAKISTGIGGAQTLAEIAIIVGALATGYGIVKSLQGNQPRLAKGERYVTRGQNPPGIDTIPAWLNEGEAVIPADKNKEYHPTVKAIFDGKIPAEKINNFVQTYHTVKQVPQVNYERIRESTTMKVSADGKLASIMSEQNRKLDENNDLQRQTLRAMKNMSISATIDRDGVAIAVNEYIQQMVINKKV